MNITAYEDCPMLSRIRILVNLLGDELAKASLFGKPLASKSRNGVPTYLYKPMLPLDMRLILGDDIRLMAKAQPLLKSKFPLQQLVLSHG
jgi:hypothetical protein